MFNNPIPEEESSLNKPIFQPRTTTPEEQPESTIVWRVVQSFSPKNSFFSDSTKSVSTNEMVMVKKEIVPTEQIDNSKINNDNNNTDLPDEDVDRLSESLQFSMDM